MKREFKGIWIPKHIWENKNLSISEVFVLAEIDSYDNDFGCIATNKTICADLRIKPSTTSGIIKSLEEKGFITITYKNMNTFEGRTIVVNQHPFGNPKGASVSSGGPSEISEPSNTFSNTLVKKENIKEKMDAAFDVFWNAYPNKVAKEKARQSFCKLKIEDIKKIFATLPTYVANPPFPEYRFPNPTTYLNQRRFDDEIKLLSPAGPQQTADREVYTESSRVIDHSKR